MKYVSALTSLALLLALPATLQAAEEGKPTRMAVMNLQNDAELKEGIVTTLNEILLGEFSAIEGLEILGSSDITSMLSLEEERIKLTGCAEDSCLAEIGGALGVAMMATARVGAVGDNYVVSVKIIDVKRAKVKGRISEVVERDDSELIRTIKRAVVGALKAAKVTGIGGAVARTKTAKTGPAKTEPAKTEPAKTEPEKTEAVAKVEPAPDPGKAPEKKEPMTFMDIAPWLGLGLTVVAGGVGGAMGGLAMKDSASADGEFKGSPDFRNLEDSASTKALVADVMFGVAGAAAVATVVLFVVGALGGDDKPKATGAILPTRDGAAATFAVQW